MTTAEMNEQTGWTPKQRNHLRRLIKSGATIADLHGANLYGANLRGANYRPNAKDIQALIDLGYENDDNGYLRKVKS
jgi:hypothetical protein